MKLTILTTSDIHGYLYPTDYMDEMENLPIGLLKAASVIDQERAMAEGPVILIENGDYIQGSPLSQFLEEKKQSPEELISVLNDIKYDVGIIGNHEFNYGLNYLHKGLEATDFPVLSANILQDNHQYLADAPYTIIEKAGLKIGILGLTTQYIPHWEHPENIKNLNFLSAVKTAKDWVPKIQNEADIVVVAYHGGFESDLQTDSPTESHTGENEGHQLLKEVPGIDALITGHQHREIKTIVDDVPVVQPEYQGANVGKIVLELDDNFQVTRKEADLLSVKEAPIHKELAEKYRPLQNEVNEWLDQVIGKVDGNMLIEDAHEVRLNEHPYIEFVNQVQMYYGQADISTTALFSNTVSGYGEEITVRDVILNYPFPNTLAVIKVTGSELKEALEQSAEYFTLNEKNNIVVNPKFLTPKPQPYNYDMYEGIDYIIDVSQPLGQRITTLQFQGEDILSDDEFELVTNQYRAVGGGNYDMFSGKEFLREINLSMSDLLTEYIKERKIVPAEVNNNFHVIS